MKLLIALGGNALEDGQHYSSDPEDQLRVIDQVTASLVDLIEQGHQLIITHGNGPQVGRVLLQNEIAKDFTPAQPLDVCGAMTQGAIGYHLQQSLQSELARKRIKKSVISVITQVIVSSEDEAFRKPTKPIGIFYTKEEISRYQSQNPEVDICEDANRGYRRVVPSPQPQEIQELEAIRILVDANCVVIACGGGGIPIKKNQGFRGVVAVIDKDFTSALLAIQLRVDIFMILTTVDYVAINYNKPDQKNLETLSVKLAEKYISENHFTEGSMLPKVQAVSRFITENPDSKAVITSLNHLKLALEGKKGTWFIR